MKRKLLAVLCAVAVMLTLLPAGAGAAGTVYFTAVNDRLLPLASETMPTVSNGTLYVPYTMFDSNTTGINLGVSCSYSRSGNTLTIYNLRQMLVFDMDTDDSRNQHTGQTYTARAFTRNGLVYVPLSFTCGFFDLGWSNSVTEYGNLIRITSAAAVLDDADFIDAGSIWMSNRLREYQQSLGSTTSPDPGPGGNSSGAGTGAVRVYLAFRCDTGEAAEAILNTLDSGSAYALFFLPADVLAQRADLLRRIVGSGHGLGLLADAETEEEVLAQLEKGSLLLERILHTRTHMALVPEELIPAVTSQGWLCWETEVDAVPQEGTRPATLAANVMRALSRRTGNVHVTLDDSLVSSQGVSQLLRQLRADPYSVRLAVETDF